MKSSFYFLVIVLCAALTACGGGGSEEMSPGQRLASAPREVADSNLCASGSAGYSVVEGECHKLFTELSAATAPLPENPQTSDAPLRLVSVTPTALFNWAQVAFPFFFPGAYIEDAAYVPGYGTFLYRYYYASGNYLGVLNDYVYIYGPVAGWLVTPVGSLDDFSCAIYGCTPARTFITWTNSVNGVVVKDAGNESFAFYSDSRCLYSYARQQETTNFCLYSGQSYGSFAGVYVQVMAATSSTGGCLAVLADMYGRQIDIYTNSAGIQIVSPLSTYWETRGCS